jgi:hypothetical protein
MFIILLSYMSHSTCVLYVVFAQERLYLGTIQELPGCHHLSLAVLGGIRRHLGPGAAQVVKCRQNMAKMFERI